MTDSTKTQDTKHTPGPWAVPEYHSLFQVWADGRLVADTFTMNWHAEECEANARLIAAAPELLAFVRTLSADPETPAKYDSEMDRLIAKAEGRKP